MKSSVFLIMIPMLSLIGPLFAQRRILGGNEVKITDYPFAVNIYRPLPKGSYFVCGGIYIGDFWILSAYDNCFQEITDLDNVGTCCMGSTEVSFKNCKAERKIESVTMHPDVEYVDMVIIKIDLPFSLGNSIQYAKLPTEPYMYDNFRKDKCVSIGWGLLSSKEFYSKKLKSAPEKVVRILDVRCVFDYICSEGGACVGDYGGALLCNGDVVGIISFTTEACGGTTYSVNIGTIENLEFIDTVATPTMTCKTASAKSNVMSCAILVLLVIYLS